MSSPSFFYLYSVSPKGETFHGSFPSAAAAQAHGAKKKLPFYQVKKNGLVVFGIVPTARP